MERDVHWLEHHGDGRAQKEMFKISWHDLDVGEPLTAHLLTIILDVGEPIRHPCSLYNM